MMFRPAATVGLAALLAPAAAGAADGPAPPPFTFPQTDVTVTYQIEGQADVRQQIWADAASGKQRVDAPGGRLSVITDTVTDRATMIDNAGKTYFLEAAPPGTGDMRGRRAPPNRYQPVGDSVVAGERCTDYVTKNAVGTAVTVCLTTDGILLRASAEGSPALVAVAVKRGSVPAAVFLPPADARLVDPPPPPPPGDDAPPPPPPPQ